MGPLDLQDGVAGREDERDVSSRKRILQVEIPLLCALRDEPRKPAVPGVV
jgi:hypothetical protein